LVGTQSPVSGVWPRSPGQSRFRGQSFLSTAHWCVRTYGMAAPAGHGPHGRRPKHTPPYIRSVLWIIFYDLQAAAELRLIISLASYSSGSGRAALCCASVGVTRPWAGRGYAVELPALEAAQVNVLPPQSVAVSPCSCSVPRRSMRMVQDALERTHNNQTSIGPESCNLWSCGPPIAASDLSIEPFASQDAAEASTSIIVRKLWV
jgi:hypothetical protein